MTTSTAAASLRTRRGTSPFERPVSILSRGLVDRQGNIVLEADDLTGSGLVGALLPSFAVPRCVKIPVGLAALVALGAATSGNVDLGDLPARSIVLNSVVKHSTALTGGSAKATQTLTSDATAPSDGDTVTIGGKVYTYQTTLTNVNGNVLIGASAAAALDNLKSAINLTAGGGTTYAAATTAHPTVVATTNTDTTQVVEAITAGAGGNAIATTEGSSNLSWGAATLAGGGAVTLTAATARLITTNNNYGSGVLDVFQAVADAAKIVDVTPKSENWAAVTQLSLAMALTGANANTLLTGVVDVWVLYYTLP